jgi:hypothetical protein
MSGLFKTLLAGSAALVAGLWILKSIESERNLVEFQILNPCTAAACKGLDKMCSAGSDSVLRTAANNAARVNNSEKVICQELWAELINSSRALSERLFDTYSTLVLLAEKSRHSAVNQRYLSTYNQRCIFVSFEIQ